MISAEDDNACDDGRSHKQQNWQSHKQIPVPVDFRAVRSRSFVDVALADLPFELFEVAKTCVESLFISWWEVRVLM